MDEASKREKKNLQRKQNRLRAREERKKEYEIDVSIVCDSPGKLVNKSGNVVEGIHLNHSKELFATDVNSSTTETPVSSSFMGGEQNPERAGSDLESEEWNDESIDDFEVDGVDIINDEGTITTPTRHPKCTLL